MKAISILIFVLITFGVQSQEITSATKSLNLTLGYQSRFLHDAQKSALLYQSGEYLAGISFIRKGQCGILNIGLVGSMGDFTSRSFRDRWLYVTSYDIHKKPEIDSFPVMARLISGKFQISYLRILNQQKNIRWLAGASLKELLIYPDNHIGLLNSLGLHLNFGMLKNLGRAILIRSEIAFPALAVNTRLPWHNTATDPMDQEIKTFFKKGSRLVSLNNFRMIEFDLDMDLRLSRRMSIGAAYELNYIGIPYHQPLKSLTNSFRVKTALIL